MTSNSLGAVICELLGDPKWTDRLRKSAYDHSVAASKKIFGGKEKLKASRADTLADRNKTFPDKNKSLEDSINYHTNKGIAKYLGKKINNRPTDLYSAKINQ